MGHLVQPNIKTETLIFINSRSNCVYVLCLSITKFVFIFFTALNWSFDLTDWIASHVQNAAISIDVLTYYILFQLNYELKKRNQIQFEGEKRLIKTKWSTIKSLVLICNIVCSAKETHNSFYRITSICIINLILTLRCLKRPLFWILFKTFIWANGKNS